MILKAVSIKRPLVSAAQTWILPWPKTAENQAHISTEVPQSNTASL